ncbi:MAG: glycosyltransferase [Clostridium perfringens]|nr:glycosyltransferase [Clostridium perfringens]
MIIDLALYYLGGRGGVETVITELSKYFKRNGHTLRILMAYPSSNDNWLNTLDNVYYYGLGANTDNDTYYGFAKNYKKLLTLIGKPDICLATYTSIQSYICYYALEEGNKLSIPLVSFLHGSLKTFYSKESIGFCTSHLAISTTMKEDIKKIVGEKRIYSVGNPVNMDNLPLVLRPINKLKLLYIGSLEPEKNLSYLINILSKIKDNWSLDIIGDGSSLDILKEQSITLGLWKKINWLGWQDYPWSKVKEASLIISTSNNEGFPLSLLEGLARGIPVICSNLKTPKDFIIEGKNGWFIDTKEEYKFINLLNNIMDGTISLPSSEYCKESVNKFNSKIVINNVENVLLREIELFNNSIL